MRLGGRRTGTGGLRSACLALALLTVASTAAPWIAPAALAEGNETVARALLDSGKEKLKDGEFRAAVTLLDQALEESDAVIEAAYHKGVALERLEDSAGALVAYRWFVDACKDKGDDATKDEQTLLKRAERKIGQLAAGERELDKLGRGFAKDLIAFAKKHAEDDPTMASRALRTLLAVDPHNEEAAELADELGLSVEEDDGAEPAPKGSSPFTSLDVAEWIDFIELRSFPSGASDYGDGTVTRDLEGGAITHFSAAKSNVTRFVLELEYRVHQVHERGWTSGWVIGENADRFIGIFGQNSSVDFVYTNKKTGGRADLGSAPMPPVDMDAWHRLDVLVDGEKVEVHFDGDRKIRETLTTHAPLSGGIGVFQQRSKVEFRVARMGLLR